MGATMSLSLLGRASRLLMALRSDEPARVGILPLLASLARVVAWWRHALRVGCKPPEPHLVGSDREVPSLDIGNDHGKLPRVAH